jgi:hypothetical protein
VINAPSAPVRDGTGHAVLAMTAVGEARRFTADIDSAFAQALKATSDDLSRRLGYMADISETQEATRDGGKVMSMAAFSDADAALLSQALPELKFADVVSPLYAGGRGHLHYPPRERSIGGCLFSCAVSGR